MDGEKLIEAVREARCLWDVSNSTHKDGRGGGEIFGKMQLVQ